MPQAPVFPVIMCGGSGVRLWPASRPWRPKQFIPLIGDRSTFQEAALRVAPLAEGGSLVIVAGATHGPFIAEQLGEIGVEAVVLLEPEARDSAAAIAAACAWIETQAPNAIALIVSADHHIPDAEAFRAAARQTLSAAEAGAIVTFGMRPASPETAYGYIRPGEGQGAVKPVAQFVEKPDAERARAYVADGYLWNSGNFVAAVRTLLDELSAHAPGVAEAARAAVGEARADAGGALTLGTAFHGAPKTSIDYAVMERTSRAQVLPADFVWSDLGAWQAVWQAGQRDGHDNDLPARAEAIDSRGVLVRAPAHVDVAVVGVPDVAVIVEADAVLVCALDRSQDVKRVAATTGGRAGPRFADLSAARAWYDLWLRTSALPLWGTVGVDPAGGFREGIAPDGRPHDPRRRGRVQSRQAFVFATVATEGFAGPWAGIARQGFDWYIRHGRRDDRLFVNALDGSGAVVDATANVYEQAFAMLAMSALGSEWEGRALETLKALDNLRHPAGGYREASGQPFQANCHMHLFETCLAWDAVGSDSVWAAKADELAQFALARFIEDGRLHEFFDEAWRPLTGEAGLLEPGHHFEWAWLLERWGALRGHAGARKTARALFATGREGVDPRRGVVFNSLKADLSARDAAARLWPQTEYLKAALILDEDAHALAACEALARYLDTPVHGAWRDVMRPDGGFAPEPAPASSFYHILVALLDLAKSA